MIQIKKCNYRVFLNKNKFVSRKKKTKLEKVFIELKQKNVSIIYVLIPPFFIKITYKSAFFIRFQMVKCKRLWRKKDRINGKENKKVNVILV